MMSVFVKNRILLIHFINIQLHIKFCFQLISRTPQELYEIVCLIGYVFFAHTMYHTDTLS